MSRRSQQFQIQRDFWVKMIWIENRQVNIFKIYYNNTISIFQMYPSIQAKIWGNIGKK